MSNPVIPTGQVPMVFPAGAPPVIDGAALAAAATAMPVSGTPVTQPTAGGAPDLRTIDISGVKESRNFDELLPDGLTVEGRISGAKMDQNQNSGKWSVKFTLDVDFPASAVGVSVWGAACITTDNPFVYASLVKSTDLCGEDGKFNGQSVQDFNGKRVRWTNKEGEYNGKKKNEHAGFNHAKETPCVLGKPAQAPLPIPQAAPVVVIPSVAPAPAPTVDPTQMAAFLAFQAQQAAAAAAVIPPSTEPDFTSPPPTV